MTKARRPRKNTLYTVGDISALALTAIFTLVGEIPRYPGPKRNEALSRMAMKEPIYSGAVYSTATRIANARYRLTGPRSELWRAEQILAAAEFGKGFPVLLVQLAWGALTADSGGWCEISRPMVEKHTKLPVIRTSNGLVLKGTETQVDPKDVEFDAGPPLLVSLDPTRCWPTDDPAVPLQYIREDGEVIYLRAHECFPVMDFVLPGRNYGWCATSRVAEAVSFMATLVQWHRERISIPTADTLVVTNAPATAIEAALQRAAEKAASAGSVTFVPPAFLNPLDPNASPEAKVLNLRDLPAGFQLKDVLEWYVIAIANGLGVDYASIAPLPGSRLGTATEAEVMERMARTRLYGLILQQVAHQMNRLVMPAGISIHFVAADRTEERQQADAALTRAQERAVRIRSGEITPTIARQLAADAGDLAQEYLQLLGEVDLTPEQAEE